MTSVVGTRDERGVADRTAQLPQGARALVVDDEGIMLQIAGGMLELLGFHVDTARSCDTAMAYLAEHRYDLVLSDLVMPRVDGCELAERIKAISNKTVVVMMTGASQDKVRKKMRSRAVDRWIFKPFPFVELQQVIGQFWEEGISRESGS